jgi:hypothetical protein
VTTSNRTTVAGQTFLASSLFAASDPDGDTITSYAFWDMGSSGGHFVLNGVAQPVQAEFDVTAVQLAQLTYQSGSGTDTVWARAYDGTLWSAWSNSFTVNSINPATIAAGSTLELASAFSGTVTYAGNTGTLKIDSSSTFNGTIGGQLVAGDIIDLADVTAGANATIGYSGNNSPGTLSVGDGTHTAHIVMTGNYSLASFTPSSDGHGGTSVIDPPPTGSELGGSNDGIARRLALLTSYMASTFARSGNIDGVNPVADSATPGPQAFLTSLVQGHPQQA